jgi:hypothetical protein
LRDGIVEKILIKKLAKEKEQKKNEYKIWQEKT